MLRSAVISGSKVNPFIVDRYFGWLQHALLKPVTEALMTPAQDQAGTE